MILFLLPSCAAPPHRPHVPCALPSVKTSMHNTERDLQCSRLLFYMHMLAGHQQQVARALEEARVALQGSSSKGSTRNEGCKPKTGCPLWPRTVVSRTWRTTGTATQPPRAGRCTPCSPKWRQLPPARLERPHERVLLGPQELPPAAAPAAARQAWGSGPQARGLAHRQAAALPAPAQVQVPAAVLWLWVGGRQPHPEGGRPGGRPGVQAQPAAAPQQPSAPTAFQSGCRSR